MTPFNTAETNETQMCVSLYLVCGHSLQKTNSAVVITFYSTSDSPLTRCISIPHDGIYIRGTGAILIDFFGFDTFT